MMRWLTKITDVPLFRQLDHMIKEYNRAQIAPVFDSNSSTLTSGSSGDTVETLSFNVPFGGADVTLSLTATIDFASATTAGYNIGLRAVWDSEADSDYQLICTNSKTGSYKETVSQVRTMELAQGKHSITLKKYRTGATGGTVTASYSYTLTLRPKGE